jgi:hypothetical protein
MESAARTHYAGKRGDSLNLAIQTIFSQLHPSSGVLKNLKMKISTLGLSLTLIALVSTTFSQTALPREASELLKRYNERLKHEVILPHELAVEDLNAKLVAAIGRAQEAAQKKGDLKESVALKTEKDTVLAGGYAPDVQDTEAPPSLRIMRAAYRTSLKALELERDRGMRPQKDAFAKTLETLITKMTRAAKLDEAVALKKIRDDLVSNDTLSSSGTSPDLELNKNKESFISNPARSRKLLISIVENQIWNFSASGIPLSFTFYKSGKLSWLRSGGSDPGVTETTWEAHDGVITSGNNAYEFYFDSGAKYAEVNFLSSQRRYHMTPGGRITSADLEQDKADADTAKKLNGTKWTWGTALNGSVSTIEFGNNRTCHVNNDPPHRWIRLESSVLKWDDGTIMTFSENFETFEAKTPSGQRFGRRIGQLK